MPSVLDSLDDEQKRDAILNEGNTLVIANPGTGKTMTIAYKYAYLMEKGTSPERILCLTFTEKAKQEMEKKIIEICRDCGIRLDISKLNVFTFHGFANSYLRDKSLGTDWKILESDTERQYAIFDHLKRISAFNYGDEYLIGSIVPAISENIRFLKSYNILPDKVDIGKSKELLGEKLKSRNFTYSDGEVMKLLEYFMMSFENYEGWKKGRYLDFNDLTINFVSEFSDSDAFDFVLVDELQDVNDMEAEMSLRAGKVKFAVGDKKQAIFGFQGGAYSNFDKFGKIGKSFNLGNNRRSLQAILDYAGSFILKNSKSARLFKEELSKLRSMNGQGEKTELIITSDPPSAVAYLLRQIKGGNVAVLARKNSQLLEVSKALDFAGIDYESYSQSTISENAKNEIRVYLKALLSPSTEEKIKGLFTPFASIGLDRALDVSKNQKTYNPLDIQAMLFSGNLVSGTEFISKVFEQRILPCSAALGHDYLMAAAMIYDRLFTHIGAFGDSLDPESFDNFIMLISDTLENQNREKDISLLTVHKAKGSEYDAVIYLPELTSRQRVPALKLISESILESSGINAAEEVEEEDLRTDFVAFTRAKEKLFIIIPDERDKNRMVERFFVSPDLSVIRDLKVSEYPGNEIEMKYSEAWKHFVSKDYEGAKRLLESEEKVWLLDAVRAHFSGLNHLSYSSVNNGIKDPYGYLMGKVLKVSPFSKSSTDALYFGSKMHKCFESYGKGVNVSSMLSDPEEKIAFDNFLVCLSDIRAAKGDFRFRKVEADFSAYVNEIFGLDTKMLFTGKTDAILEFPDGYMIIDYKTDGTEDKDNKHMKQLEVYRRMFAFSNDIEPEKIDTAVVYVSLVDKINTGRMDGKVVFGKQGGGKLFDKFTDDVSSFLQYSRHPELFLDYVFEKGPGYGSPFAGYMFETLKGQWKREAGIRANSGQSDF